MLLKNALEYIMKTEPLPENWIFNKLAHFYVTYFWTEKCSLQFQNKHDLWIDYLKLSFSPVAEVDPGYSCVSRAGL